MDERKFTQRITVLILFMGLICVTLISRMFYLQIIESQHYRSLAEGNRIALQSTIPPRGQILDRNGEVLANNTSSFKLTLSYERGMKLDDIFEKLEEIVTFSDEEKEKIKDRIKHRRGIDPVTVKDNLSWDQVSKIEMDMHNIKGLNIEIGLMRSYPKPYSVGHVGGYVSAPSPEEQEEDPILQIPGLPIGKVGIEKQMDKELRGTPGYRELEVNAARRVVRQVSEVPPIPGKDLILTIDMRLQNYIQDRLSEHESASAIVMDVENGEVISFVSHPGFDPNLFVDGISHVNWRSLMDNPYKPLTNKAVAGTYAPGSTLKALVVLAALESGIVNPNTSFVCPGHMYLGDHKFHCWRKGGHGTVNAERAIVESCDVYFYEVSKRLGIDKLKNIFEMFGLNQKHLANFPHEKQGLVPSKDWKQARQGQPWRVSDSIMTSIGQGYMLATPLQLAVVAARIASGKAIEPVLVKNLESHKVFPDLPINLNNLSLAQRAMRDVVNAPNGTAYRFHLDNVSFAGKTGTSQVRRISMKDRQNNLTKTHHLDWKYREHGLFLGYYPSDNPKYAVAVVIEHCTGGSFAAKAARDIFQKMHELEAEDVAKLETTISPE